MCFKNKYLKAAKGALQRLQNITHSDAMLLNFSISIKIRFINLIKIIDI